MTEQMNKIYFTISSDHSKAGETESLWGARSENYQDREAFIIHNIPFFIYNLSFNDTVYATPRDYGGFEFEAIADRGGHSTYRILIGPNFELFKAWLLRLEALGCTYESGDWGSKTIYAIDVPKTSNIYEVYDILMNGLSKGVWFVEEAHVGHSLKGKT